ncbi:MAG: hypothetical protein ACFCVK_21335 [Acidimicrobiales bacterium]
MEDRSREEWQAPAHLSVAQPDALTGFELYAGDKALGACEEMVELEGERYYLVDTRHWTFGERRLIPASSIRPALDERPRAASTDLDVEFIRRAPDFNPFRLNDSRHLAALREYYRRDTSVPRPRRIG